MVGAQSSQSAEAEDVLRLSEFVGLPRSATSAPGEATLAGSSALPVATTAVTGTVIGTMRLPTKGCTFTGSVAGVVTGVASCVGDLTLSNLDTMEAFEIAIHPRFLIVALRSRSYCAYSMGNRDVSTLAGSAKQITPHTMMIVAHSLQSNQAGE